MTHLGHHIRFRLADGSVIADSRAKRLHVIRVVLEHGRRYNLLAAALADSHLHAQARGGRSAAGAFTHGVEASLKQRLGLPVGFVLYEPEPIRDQRHAHNALRYILTQHQRHEEDPLSQLHRAAQAAACLDTLCGSGQQVIAARRAMLAVIGRRLTNHEAAALSNVAPRTVSWLRARAADEDLVHAIRLQLGAYRTAQREPTSALRRADTPNAH